MSRAPGTPLPPLVAHRGDAADHPENTIEAPQSAVDLGLRHVEFDVQLTADGVPVMLHDADLRRVAGRPECVHDLDWAALAQVAIGEPTRFGDRFRHVRPASLARVVEAVRSWRDVTAFVEVKRASLRRFGHDAVLERVASAVAPALSQCVLISFDLPAVQRLRESAGARIGWVIERYDEATRRAAEAAAPEYLFADLDAFPADAARLWPGPWDWAVYEITGIEAARQCAALGASLVETMQVRAMLAAYARDVAP